MTRQDSDTEAIRQVIQQINESWLAKRYDEIGSFLVSDAVIALPGSTERVLGRDAYVRSYREYDDAAKTHEFRAETPQIDLIGDVAVAVCPFFIDYELQGKRYREGGKDLLVFRRFNDEWRVVWRTMKTEPAQSGGG